MSIELALGRIALPCCDFLACWFATPRREALPYLSRPYGARKYLEELEQENGDGEPIHQQDQVSTTDPDST